VRYGTPTDISVSPVADPTENELILEAVVASGCAYWDDDPNAPCLRVRVDRPSIGDRRPVDRTRGAR
jgi:hypothetical protein